MNDIMLKEILKEYDEYRATQAQAARAREAHVLASIPELAQLRNDMVGLLAERSRASILDPSMGTTALQDLQMKIDAAKETEHRLLAAHGYTPDFLLPHYRCSICKDTGYLGELVREKCKCLQQRLIDQIYRCSDIAEVKTENFQAFDPSVFPDDPIKGSNQTQREYMLQLKALLMQYQSEFPQNVRRNILFTGKTGLGKTFLLNCLAKSILDKDHTVLKITSYNLFETLFRSNLKNDMENFSLKDKIFSVDTLIIDDLGTEAKRNNHTAEELFNILNERFLAKKHTFLSTNLMLTELKEWYSDRVTSRLFDTSNTMIIRFWGQDIRLKAKSTI